MTETQPKKKRAKKENQPDLLSPPPAPPDIVLDPAADDSGGETVVTQLKPGIYEKIPPSIYHRQDSFSRHDMCRAKVPAKLKWHKDHPQTEESTPSQIIGGAFHTRLLEPDVFEARYTLKRYADYRTNEAKNWRDEQEAKGLTIITKDQMDMIDEMVQSCREHPDFGRVFKSPRIKREVTVVAKDPATGILLRARYDVLPFANIHADIKSAEDASPEGFGKAAWNYEYGMQAAHYIYVWNLANPDDRRNEFIFLVQEKEQPYLATMYCTPHSLIDYCSKILRARRYVIAECMATGRWPGYEYKSLRENEFELPRWAASEIEESEKNG